MIYFVTGTPGAGKSLFTIDFILTETGQKQKILKGKKKQTQWSDRPVYYHHIDGLDESKTEWQKLEHPERWQDCPEGSIIIIDEAHKFYPKVGKGTVPKYIEDMSEHRHNGYDMFFITQNPMMVNHHIRGLVNFHYHYERQQGWEQNTRYLWNRLGKPNDYHDMKVAEKKRNRFAKVKYVYDLYKSSSEHTSKKRIPPMLLVGLALLVFLAYTAHKLYNTFWADKEPVQQLQESLQVDETVETRKVSYSQNDSVKERYNQHFRGETIIKNYYPAFIVNSIEVYKSQLADFDIDRNTYYEFKTSEKTYRLTRKGLKEYSINVDQINRCRDSIFLPEMSTILYTTCQPQEVVNTPLLYSSGLLDTTYKAKPKRAVIRSNIRSNHTNQPKQPPQQPNKLNVNPFF